MFHICTRVLACVAITALSPFASAAGQNEFTLEEVLSSPFPTSLTAAPIGGSVAWVQNAGGVRNIWIAEPPDFRGRQLSSYRADDGQELSDLQFTSDGLAIVYVRGGNPNRQGEIPNPTSDPVGAERAIWLLPLSGERGGPRRLAVGSSPAIAPTGNRIAFLRGGQVWAVATDEEWEAQQLFKVRGRAGGLGWSPDGSKLAFVSNRGDHSFVGVYDLGQESLHYLDPSIDLDHNPAWSPDGALIAFVRTPHERKRLPYMPRRSAYPWSIRIADPETGEGREVWMAEEGPGSAFRGIEAENQIFWSAGGRLVFPWERNGWTHLYSVSAAGGEVTLLTPGAFEVQHVFLSPDREEVLFSSNQGDIDRRHLWRVPVSGGSPSPITSGEGVEWSPVLTADGGAVAFFASGARTPAHASVTVDGGEPQPLAPGAVPADFPLAQLVEPKQVIFAAADGMRIHGQLFLPGDLRDGDRRPAVVFFHGGSRRQMLLGWHYRGYYHNAYALNQYLASRGYIVLSVNYRSGIGYGMEFREALNYGARGASEFNDVLGAGLYLRSRPDVDGNRIGLWGGSYGGYLTALGLARASHLFAAGVDLHGVHDWNIEFEFDRRTLPDDLTALDEAKRLAFASSPMAYVAGWTSPVLFIHGDDDRNVPFRETVDLAEALREQGVEFEQLVFPDEVHGFLRHASWLAAYRAAAGFFDRKLKEP